MPLILAIEPDRRQAAHLTAMVKKRVRAELILVGTTERALDAIGNRVPDLILVPALLSPQDDAALATALRVIASAANVQMLTIPVLGTPRPAAKLGGGVLSALRRDKSRSAETDGCDPAVFAEQIRSYLKRAAEERGEDMDLEPEEETPSVPPAFEAVEARSVAVEPPPVVESTEFPPVEFVQALAEVEAAQAVEAQAAEAAEVAAEVAPEVPEVNDESVSIALEEAVRALFSDPAPAPAPEPFAEPPAPPRYEQRHEKRHQERHEERHQEPIVPMAAEPVFDHAAPMSDAEWAAVDELMSALEVLPLATVDMTEGGDWAPPVFDFDRMMDQVTTAIDEEPEEKEEEDDVDLTTALKAAGRRAEAPAPAPAKSEREWVALIESLRHDVERLRTEGADKPVARQQQPPPPAAARAGKPAKKAKPVQDEWGFFDPEQCGFAALLAKLEEVTDDDDEPSLRPGSRQGSRI